MGEWGELKWSEIKISKSTISINQLFKILTDKKFLATFLYIYTSQNSRKKGVI